MNNGISNIYKNDDFVKILQKKLNKGETVNLIVTGNSMVPFLVSKRDSVLLTTFNNKPEKGDILFYKRANGKCVLHRVYDVKDNKLFFIGDAQDKIEGPLTSSYILAECKAVFRKGKLIEKNDLIWKFFSGVWLHIIPLRLPLIRFYGKLKKLFK